MEACARNHSKNITLETVTLRRSRRFFGASLEGRRPRPCHKHCCTASAAHDREAKKRIGSSVFLGARWNVWGFKTCAEANLHYWDDGDKGISKQLWSIREKLREVNEAMTPERQTRLMETHPELVFWRLNSDVNSGVRLDKKKADAGRKQRMALLKRYGFDQIETWLGQRHGTGIGRDDLIDAGACALAAWDSKQWVPAGVARDERGIRMEIWY